MNDLSSHYISMSSPANTKHGSNNVSMLGHRLWDRLIIKTKSGQFIVCLLGSFWIYSDDDLGQFRDGQKMTLTGVDNDTGQLGEPELLTGSKFGDTKGT